MRAAIEVSRRPQVRHRPQLRDPTLHDRGAVPPASIAVANEPRVLDPGLPGQAPFWHDDGMVVGRPRTQVRHEAEGETWPLRASVMVPLAPGKA